MVGNTMQWLFLNKELLLLRLRKASVISSGIKQGTKLLTKIHFSALNNQIWPFNVKSGEKLGKRRFSGFLVNVQSYSG